MPAKRVDICFRDLTKPSSPFDVLVWGLDSRFSTIYAKGAWYVRTDYSSPNGRILRADPGIMPEAWKTIVPEGKDVIETFSIVGGKIYVKRLHDVKSETSVYTLDGKPAGTDRSTTASAPLPASSAAPSIATASSASSPSFSRRPSIASTRSPANAKSSPNPKIPFDTAQYELKQVFYKSKDGTQIPMFIAGKKGLKQDGSERLLMTGYGGFNLSETPDVESRLGLVASAGRLVRRAQPARRRRVRRELARAGHVREEAERLRRLVRRCPLPHRPEVHVARALRHHAAAPMAAC